MRLKSSTRLSGVRLNNISVSRIKKKNQEEFSLITFLCVSLGRWPLFMDLWNGNNRIEAIFCLSCECIFTRFCKLHGATQIHLHFPYTSIASADVFVSSSSIRKRSALLFVDVVQTHARSSIRHRDNNKLIYCVELAVRRVRDEWETREMAREKKWK